MEMLTKSRSSRRSWKRRLITPVLSAAAVLGGGTWGVNHFLALEDTQEVDASMWEAHSAPTDKQDLQNLFASTPEESKPAEKAAIKPKQEDRYTLTSAKTTKEEKVNPFAALPVAKETEVEPVEAKPVSTKPVDRYADYEPNISLPPLAPTPANENEPEAEEDTIAKSELGEGDVTRGQEPGINPLRSAPISTPAGNDLEARSSFEAPTPITSTQKSEPISNPFGSARPLQPAAQTASVPSTPAPAANGRYFNGNSEPMDTPPPTPAYTQAAPSVTPVREMPTTQTIATPQYQEPPSYEPQNNMLAGIGGPSNITPTPGLTTQVGTGRPGERLLEGAQSPSITIQKISPEEIQVGKRCTFAIKIQNTGQRTAQNVQIHDEIPLGTELVGTAPRASVSGSNVVWELGTLSVGEERTVEMELLPTEEGELGSVATVLMAAQASSKSRCTRPELALRLSATKPHVLMGEQQIIQIEVSNPGSGDATGVMLLETVPAGVSHEAGPALEFEVGTLKAGESQRLELMLSAEKAGQIQNVMTARADASLQVEAGCEFEVIAPELALSIEGPQKRYLERPATYKVSIDNPGTATAHDVQLVTHLPKGLQFVSANNMGEYDASTHTVQWSLVELPANERGTVELVALPIEPGTQTLQVATKANQGLEDRMEKEVKVEGLAALMFEVADLADPIEIGGETTYEIRVVNQGSKSASNVQVVAILPPGLRALSGQGETRHTIQGERVIFAPLPSLGPKADTTFRIQVQGTRPGDQRLRVQINTDDIQQPITKEESTRVYADE